MQIDEPAIAELVIAELRERLLRRGSALATARALDGGLELQSRSILAETFAALGAGAAESSSVAAEYGEPEVLTAHGQRSAVLDIDPSAPLVAAEVLFDVALPLVADTVAEAAGRQRDLEVARALHHAIWRRFPPGAIAYVEVLREQLRSSDREARLRIARELHDRIAHGIAAGMQRLEAAQLRRPDPEVARAIGILRDTLMDTQDLAVDLRTQVGSSELVDALKGYASATGGRGTLPVRVSQAGTTRPLSDLAREQLFMIATEAIRNARTHAEEATAVQVRLQWSPTDLHVTVTDDGLGYDDAARGPSSLGLRGIAERADAIGANVEFLTAAGGAGIRSTLPFVGTRAT